MYIMYHIAEGIFTSFDYLSTLYGIPPWDFPNQFEPLELSPTITPVYPSLVWGRTCDVFDYLGKHTLPEVSIMMLKLREGD